MKLVATAVLIILAGQASALSCIRPDVVATFKRAAASDDSYLVLLGNFTFATRPPQGGVSLTPEPVSLPARFNGQMLAAEGFVDRPAIDLTLNFTCAGPWCGSLTVDTGDMLAFVRQTAQGYALDIGPCGGFAFSNVNPIQVQRVEACMRGEACQEGEVLR